MDKEKLLKDIFDNDPLGLLNVKPSIAHKSDNDRLITSFKEITEFYRENQREPDPGNGVNEYQLYSRLKGLREHSIKKDTLLPFDSFGLLSKEEKRINSIEDIFTSDDLGLFDDGVEELFSLKNIKPLEKERAEADFVAKRKVCKDFSKYELLFKLCHSELKSGERKIVKFHENQIQKGAFFVLNGLLLYVENLIDITVDKFGKRDGRTKLIFENGTESNMLFRSLGKGLLESGQGVTFKFENDFLTKKPLINEDDLESGHIYILKSQSDKEEIKSIRNLYKIGFSKNAIEDRIKNAEKEPTYLMSPVRIVMGYKCFNMNPQKLEHLVHTFFGGVCVAIDVVDLNGIKHTPREWFVAPLSVIEQSVHLIITGEIINYLYDKESQEIIRKATP